MRRTQHGALALVPRSTRVCPHPTALRDCPGAHARATARKLRASNDAPPPHTHTLHSLPVQDKHGQVMETHSISAGLDYPGVGPEHSFLKDTGRASYVPVNDKQALEALQVSAVIAAPAGWA